MADRKAYWIPWTWVFCIHALLAFIAVGLTVLSVWSDLRLDVGWQGMLNTVVDFLGVILWVPLQPLLTAGRMDIFFMVLPLNSVLYAFVLWTPVYWARRVRS